MAIHREPIITATPAAGFPPPVVGDLYDVQEPRRCPRAQAMSRGPGLVTRNQISAMLADRLAGGRVASAARARPGW